MEDGENDVKRLWNGYIHEKPLICLENSILRMKTKTCDSRYLMDGGRIC